MDAKPGNPPRRSKTRSSGAIALICGIGLGILAYWFRHQPLDEWIMAGQSYIIALGLLLWLSTLSWTKQKIISLIHPVFIDFVSENEYRGEIKSRAGRLTLFALAIICVWFCAGFACFGVFLILNATLDFSQTTTHQTAIVSFFAGDTQSPSTIKVASWRPRRSTEELTILKSEAGLIVQGERRVHVTTKSGALGFEWVKEIKVIPEPHVVPAIRRR